LEGFLARRSTKGFFKNFYKGAKSGEVCFFPFKTKKITSFAAKYPGRD